MKQVAVSAVTAAIVCLIAFGVDEWLDADEDETVPAASADVAAADPAAAFAPATAPLAFTVEPAEDSWVNGARGPGADDRMLSDADHSICFLTKVEVSGIQGPEDRGTCRIDIDDFTGFWKVTADVPEGSRSEIRCNARCLEWEEGEE